MLDAVIVGSGPNGLAAAVTLAAAGRRVLVIEGRDTIGGGTRTEELTEPGVRHDVCSAVHPLGIGSPFLTTLPLSDHGLEWVHPPIPFAHAMDDGDSVVVHRSLDETAAGLGADGAPWMKLFAPIVRDWETMVDLATGPPLRAAKSPVAGLRLGRHALRSGKRLARRFSTPRGKAAIAGLAAHAIAPLDTPASGGVALVLGAAAHAVGWPVARGGSASITSALASYFESLGGEIEVGRWVTSLDDLPPARVVMFDTAPEAIAGIASDRLSATARRRFRARRPGPGVFKLDLTTDRPIPWEDERLASAGTVHLGGTFEEIAQGELETTRDGHPARPFVLLAQPLTADPSRAPAGTGIVWAYCHVPSASREDMTESIVGQIERFAPGFSNTIRSVSAMGPAELEARNPNHLGGDITGGPLSLWGILARPTPFRPYRASRGIYLCSSSTPPGAGVHGMCGHHAARAALKELG